MALNDIVQGWNGIQEEICDKKFDFFSRPIIGRLTAAILLALTLYGGCSVYRGTGLGGQVASNVAQTYGINYNKGDK